MSLRVVGVGLGRTGTHSLKLALEQLLGAPCHHMLEVIANPDQIPLWTDAADGRADWDRIFDGYAATVDWPSAGFWRVLVDRYPEAVVLLSQRQSADAWWTSADRTIFELFHRPLSDDPALAAMSSWMETVRHIVARNGVDPDDPETSKRAYERHLEDVRGTVDSGRLVEWTSGQGWGPLCKALDMPEPQDPFPHVNTTDEFRAVLGLDA